MLGVVHDAFVQVARVRVERRDLSANRLHHMGVAMAHRHHIVVGVQVLLAVGGIEPGTEPLHEVERMLVEEAVARPEHPPALDELARLGVEPVQIGRLEAVRVHNGGAHGGLHACGVSLHMLLP